MEELFENSILEDLFNVRTDGFESLYEIKHKNSVNFEEEIKEILKTSKNNVNKIIESFEELFLKELNYWNFAYYKLGIIDGINMLQEINKELKYWKK